MGSAITYQLKAVTVLIQLKWEQTRFVTYLEALHELTPLDVAVLVGVEGIEDDAKLLSCEEDAKF